MVSCSERLAEAKAAIAGLSIGLAPVLYAHRKNRVLQAYDRAVQAAQTKQQLCNVHIALCSAYLIFVELNSSKGSSAADSLAYVQQAASHVVVAAAQQTDKNRVQQHWATCLQSAVDLIAELDLQLNDALSFWARMVTTTAKQTELSGVLSLAQARWLLGYGQQCMAAGPDYKTGLKCCHEASGPVETALQCAHRQADSTLMEDGEELKEEIYTFMRCTCEATQARIQADRQMDSFGLHPHEEEIWQVVDQYTQSLRQTGEQDLLTECCAHARLGQVFDKYLKMRSKAVQNCKRAVELAHAIRPPPIGHDWYQECNTILLKIQREQQAEEEAKKNIEYDNILQALQPELSKIKAAKQRGARDLLVHLKQKHPPKFKSNLAEPAYDEIRQALRKASVEYHPDKQLQYDQRWRVLSTEICKSINDVYKDYCS